MTARLSNDTTPPPVFVQSVLENDSDHYRRQRHDAMRRKQPGEQGATLRLYWAVTLHSIRRVNRTVAALGQGERGSHT